MQLFVAGIPTLLARYIVRVVHSPAAAWAKATRVCRITVAGEARTTARTGSATGINSDAIITVIMQVIWWVCQLGGRICYRGC